MNKHFFSLVALIGCFLGDCFSTRLFAQSPCDPSLPLVVQNAMGYRNRGDRCEGLYIKQVSSTALFVASFTRNFENYDVNSGENLLIEWRQPPGNNPIHLRAQGIKPKLYYRMDAYRAPSDKTYSWPSGILTSLKILKKDLGIVGFTKAKIGNVEQDIYLPLMVTQKGQPSISQNYTLLLLPGVQLSEVYVSLAPVAPDGRAGNFIRQEEKLGYGYYPADRPVEIPIKGLTGSGYYYLRIGATLGSGTSSSIELWFYNPS